MNDSSSGFRALFIIVITLLLALLLTMLPLPAWAVWLRPKWVVLVTLYWAMAMPSRFNVGAAWLIGLILDITQGTLLGQQALILAVIIYIVNKMQRGLQTFSLLQKTFAVLALILLYQILMFGMQSLLAKIPFSWHYWLPSLTSALFWPWVYALLKGFQRYFRLVDPSMRGYLYTRD